MSPEIIPIIDRRPEFVDKPGMHALIVGVSAYPHLEGGTGTKADDTFGLKQLSSTALTAYKVFSWLKEWQDKLKPPLVTCRLLLSPSPIEKDIEVDLRDLDRSYPATRRNFDFAAKQWREDANLNKQNENVTFFYFAGHGAQLSKDNAIMLLEDFGDGGEGGIFDKAVEVQNFVGGMKITPKRSTLARTQMYFIDSCRIFSNKLKNVDVSPRALWDPNIGGTDDRLAPVFYAALPGDTAYGIKGEQTYFGEALLRCLEGGAGELREFEEFDGEERWYISIRTLTNKILDHVNDLNKRKKRNQVIDVNRIGNRDIEKIICFLDGPPSVDVIFKVEPHEARQYIKVEIFNDKNEEVRESEPPIPLEPNPYEGRLDAGYYTFNARIIKPAQRDYQDYEGKSRLVMPPCYERNMRVKK